MIDVGCSIDNGVVVYDRCNTTVWVDMGKFKEKILKNGGIGFPVRISVLLPCTRVIVM